MIDDVTAARPVGRAGELRTEEIAQRKPARQNEAGVAVIWIEEILSANERQTGAGLYGFVTFGTHRDRDFALPIELKPARIDRSLREHAA